GEERVSPTRRIESSRGNDRIARGGEHVRSADRRKKPVNLAWCSSAPVTRSGKEKRVMSAVIVGVRSVARQPAGTEVLQFGTCVRWIRAARLHGFRVESIATRSRRLAAIAAVIAVAIGASPRV